MAAIVPRQRPTHPDDLVDGGKYVVTFRPYPHYEATELVGYFSCLHLHKKRLYVVVREGDATHWIAWRTIIYVEALL